MFSFPLRTPRECTVSVQNGWQIEENQMKRNFRTLACVALIQLACAASARRAGDAALVEVGSGASVFESALSGTNYPQRNSACAHWRATM